MRSVRSIGGSQVYDTFEYRVHASHTVGMKKRRKSEQGDRREKEEDKRARKLEARFDPLACVLVVSPPLPRPSPSSTALMTTAPQTHARTCMRSAGRPSLPVVSVVDMSCACGAAAAVPS